jgi:hypothetical protein
MFRNEMMEEKKSIKEKRNKNPNSKKQKQK